MYCNALERRQPMAYSVAQRVISKKDSIYDYCDDLSRKSKLLYNASLFRIRNIFTGYEKEHLTSNEAEVFGEVKLLHESYPGIHIQKVICYKHLEKLMRVTENPDFFAGLPMQTAQAIVKQAVTDFNNWLKSLKAYAKHPEDCHITKRTALLLSRSQTRMLFYIQKSPGSP